ncbi:MAG: hypothetical protein IPN76_12465 [Saprospiraceae bacterium]|nr:hypothetical protein [Saprospiraceae bacterium]
MLYFAGYRLFAVGSSLSAAKGCIVFKTVDNGAGSMGVPCVLSSKIGGGNGAWGDILTRIVGFRVTGWQVGISIGSKSGNCVFCGFTNQAPMKKQKPKVDVDQVLATIDRTLKEIREGFKPEELTAEERAEVMKGIMKVIVQAHKCKLNLRISELEESNPNASTREAMIYALTSLPDDLPTKSMMELAKCMSEMWENRKSKVI